METKGTVQLPDGFAESSYSLNFTTTTLSKELISFRFFLFLDTVSFSITMLTSEAGTGPLIFYGYLRVREGHLERRLADALPGRHDLDARDGPVGVGGGLHCDEVERVARDVVVDSTGVERVGKRG